MKILIIGGGIAGPALVSQLKKHNVDCEVILVEQAPEFKNIGYGIVLWGNGRKVLKEIGIDEGVIAREGYEVPWDAFEKNHRPLQYFSFKQFEKFGPTIFIPRSVLHGVIINQVDPKIVKLGTKPVAIRNNGTSKNVWVGLSNRTSDIYDLVVAADGIHSWVREQIFGPGFVKYYGWSMWVLWIPRKFTLSKGAIGMTGHGKLAKLFPMQDQAMLSLMAKRRPGIPDNIETRKRNLRDLFHEFGDPIRHMIESVPSDKDILFNDAAYVDIKEWYKNRVVLIGDAKHATSPIMGMGTSLALEDACVLAQEISKNKNLDQALKSFSIRRDRRLNKFRKATKRFEDWLLATGIKAKIRDLAAPFLPESFFLGPIKHILNEEM